MKKRAVVCFYCQEEGHIRRECPKNTRSHVGKTRNDKPLLCFNCNAPGHMRRDCPKLDLAEPKPLLCFNCNAPGHMRRDCPKLDLAEPMPLLCFNCNAPEHMRRDCPVYKGTDASPSRKITSGAKKNPDSDVPRTRDDEIHAVNEVEGKCTTHQITSQASYPPPGPSQTGLHTAEVSDGGSITLGTARVELSPPSNSIPTTHQKDFHTTRHGGGEVDIKDPQQNCAQDNSVGQDCTQESVGGGDKQCNSAKNAEIPSKTDSRGYEVKRDDDGGGSEVKKRKKRNDGSEVQRGDGEKRRDGGNGRRSVISFPPFIDTHCHLEYVFERHRHQGTFSDFKNRNSYPKNFDGCIASFCDPAAFSSFGIWRDLVSEPDVWAAFGVHPHNAKYYHTQHLEEKVIESVQHEKCVAFGEIGLDYAPHSSSNPETQREVFSRLLKVGVTLGKPFVVHCRDAEDDLIRLMSADVPADWKIHLHCFTGKLDIARHFLEQFPNLYLGVTGNVTYKDCVNVRTVAREVPLERLLVETDAPYNTPRNLPRAGRCKFSHPAHAHYVTKEIAYLREMDLSEVLRVIRENTRKVYGV